MLAHTRVPLRLWLYGLLVYTEPKAGMSRNPIQGLLGTTKSVASNLVDAFRTHIALAQGEHRLGGAGKTVSVDETSIRIGPRWQQVILLGLTDGDHCALRIVPNRRASTLLPLIAEQVLPGSIVVTDGLSSYRDVPRLGFAHSVVHHGQNMWVNAAGHCNVRIEQLWAVTKRLIKRRAMYMSEDHLWKYLAEVTYRYNAAADPTAAWWRLISSFSTIGVEDIERARRRIDRRPTLAPSAPPWNTRCPVKVN